MVGSRSPSTIQSSDWPIVGGKLDQLVLSRLIGRLAGSTALAMIERGASQPLVAQVQHLNDLLDAGGDRGPVRHCGGLPLVVPLIAHNLAGSCRDEKAAR